MSIIKQHRRRAIIAAHGGVCFYCGKPDAAHVDHIIPKADGGGNDLGNLIAACLSCNLYKKRHRLAPDVEAQALAAAEAKRAQVLALETTMREQPAKRECGEISSVKVIITLSVEEWKILDEARFDARMRSVGAFCHHLIREDLVKSGKLSV